MTMGKFISNMFLAALAIGLSIFTASRTLDLLAWALPKGQDFYQWLGLAAFEGGMYFWSFYFVSGAKGTQQRSIALCMAVGSVLAVCIATVVDLSLDASLSGKLPPLSASTQQSMILFVGIVITLNVAAFLACKLMSPEKLREITSGQAEDKIYAEGLRAIEAVAPTLAADAAPYLAADWSNRVWNQIVPGVQRNTLYLGPTNSGVPALHAPVISAPAPAPQPVALQSSEVSVPVPAVPAHAPVESKPRKLLGFLSLPGKKQEQLPAFKANQGIGAAVAKQFDADRKGKVVEATLAQEATVPVAPATGGRASGSTYAKMARARVEMRTELGVRQARRSHAAGGRRARRASVAPSSAPVVKASAPVVKPAAKAPESRVCSECSQPFEVKNAKQLTCSKVCRAKRSRRLSKERKA